MSHQISHRNSIVILLTIITGLALAFVLTGMARAGGRAALSDRTPQAPDSPTVYRVSKSGDGSNGLSWTTAFTDLQDALGEAESGDEIWVATGVYTPGATRSDSFNLVPGVEVYGGFAGTETSRGQRDWVANQTILSGDIDGDDTSTGGVVLTTTHIVGGNSYHVVYADGTTGTTITGSTKLDGFTITAGKANGADFPNNAGGGFFCEVQYIGNVCSPSLKNLIFSGNLAIYGGAVYNDGWPNATSSPSLTNVTFSGNSADYGGAMYNDSDTTSTSSPSITNVTFSGNSAKEVGGAMYNGRCSPALTNVTFSGNSAGKGAGAMFNQGLGGNSSPTLTNVVFSGNKAGNNGGAMFNNGASGISKPVLTNVTFSGNSAGGTGGAMMNRTTTGGTSEPDVRNSILWNNQDSSGTGTISATIYNQNAAVTLTNSLVQGSMPGGIWIADTSYISIGGNIDDDPNFVLNVDPSNAPTEVGNLRLNIGSPAIDKGADGLITETTDLDGLPRSVDGDGDISATVDMGAYEFQCPTGPVVYVDQDAPNPTYGNDWQTALLNPQGALEAARTCGGVDEIWVATGVYTPGVNRSDSFKLVPDMEMYGGFAGTEVNLAERDWENNITVLSGDIAGDDISNANGVVTTSVNISGTNNYHVIFADGTTGKNIDVATKVDGFYITAGRANGSFAQGSGGGFFCKGSGNGNMCSPDLKDIAFYGNSAIDGGAIFNDGEEGESSPTFTNVRFHGNSVFAYGGAIYNNGLGGKSNPYLENVTFKGNSSTDGFGGAVYNRGKNGGESSPSFINVVFSGNKSLDEGGAIHNFGVGGDSSPSFINVLFSGNKSFRGGALSNTGGYGISVPTLINVTFSGNLAYYGGAIYNDGINGVCTPNIRNSIIWNNQDNSGNGTISATIYNQNAAVTLTNSLVQGSMPGGIWITDSTYISTGGNIDINPNFMLGVDPSSAPTAAGDLRLQFGSPSIDAGKDEFVVDVPTDLDGEARVKDGDGDGTWTVDMGAYEAPGFFMLSVSKSGTGRGKVTGTAGGIDCGETCQALVEEETAVTLEAVPEPGSRFVGWGGDCSGDGACPVTMDGVKSVSAEFEALNRISMPLMFR